METHSVVFQIFGMNISPNSISDQLGLAPDESLAPDTVIGTYKGKEHTTGVGTWSISGRSETKQLETQIEELLPALRLRKEALEELKRLGWKMRFFCGVFTDNAAPGVSLPSEMLAEVGDLGIDIDIMYYFQKSDL